MKLKMFMSKIEIREFLLRFFRESKNEFKDLGANLENVTFQSDDTNQTEHHSYFLT